MARAKLRAPAGDMRVNIDAAGKDDQARGVDDAAAVDVSNDLAVVDAEVLDDAVDVVGGIVDFAAGDAKHEGSLVRRLPLAGNLGTHEPPIACDRCRQRKPEADARKLVGLVSVLHGWMDCWFWNQLIRSSVVLELLVIGNHVVSPPTISTMPASTPWRRTCQCSTIACSPPKAARSVGSKRRWRRRNGRQLVGVVENSRLPLTCDFGQIKRIIHNHYDIDILGFVICGHEGAENDKAAHRWPVAAANW